MFPFSQSPSVYSAGTGFRSVANSCLSKTLPGEGRTKASLNQLGFPALGSQSKLKEANTGLSPSQEVRKSSTETYITILSSSLLGTTSSVQSPGTFPSLLGKQGGAWEYHIWGHSLGPKELPIPIFPEITIALQSILAREKDGEELRKKKEKAKRKGNEGKEGI